MRPTIICLRIVLILLLHSFDVKCSIRETLKKADGLFGKTKPFRVSRDSEDSTAIWQEHEFGTGAGNREELSVTNILIREYETLPRTNVNWEYLEANGSGYLATTTDSTLSFYGFNFDGVLTENPVELAPNGRISAFKIITVGSGVGLDGTDSGIEIVAILCVESDSGTALRWYRLLGNEFRFFWTWPVQKYIKDLQLVQRGNENKLLLLDDNEMQFGKQYSSVDVYGFNVDFVGDDYSFWLCERRMVPKVFDLQICSIYESIALAVQTVNGVSLYEFQDSIIMGGLFQELQTIKSNNLRNFVCFESGYLQYLATSGQEAALFNFLENGFQYRTQSETNFEVPEISWVKDIRVDTYRDESLLLIQFNNSTIIALAWQGLGFQKIKLPDNSLDNFDLAKVTAIPKYGFIFNNQLVKIDTELRDLKGPLHDESEGMLEVRTLLDVVLTKQESILNQTEEKIEKSYLKNPVITGFWNMTTVNVTNATITNNVTYKSVTLGPHNLTMEDLKYDPSSSVKILNNLEKELDEISKKFDGLPDAKSAENIFESDINFYGNINITGTLTVKNLTVDFINQLPAADLLNNLPNENDQFTPSGQKSLFGGNSGNPPSITLNGISMNDILFETIEKDYSDVDFSKITKLEVDGDLFFTNINGINWEAMMENIVWKNKSTAISGNTVVEGTIIADEVYVSNINGLRYPEDYVLMNNTSPINVTGTKIFDELLVGNLLGIGSINDIDINDFIIVNNDNVLDKEITFENLIAEGPIQIDGTIIGLNQTQHLLINETTQISGKIIFTNLTVLGDILIEEKASDKNLAGLNDLLLKTDKDAVITGTKTFLSNVEFIKDLKITSNLINGHHIDEFVTLDGEQELSSLEKISANVSVGTIHLGAINKLESYLNGSNERVSSNGCLQKIITFTYPITVDDLSFDTLNTNISGQVFAKKLTEAFKEVHFENLSANTLIADTILPEYVNGADYKKLTEELSAPRMIDEYEVDILEARDFQTEFVNELSLAELNDLKNHVNVLYKYISSGNLSLESLQVSGNIDTKSINDVILDDLYNEDRMGNVIFEADVSIENLTVLGFVNGLNFSEYVLDTVLKTEKDIVVTGRKVFDTVRCRHLETAFLNGHPVENILDPEKEQTLSGPVFVNGSVIVLNSFEGNGKIGDVNYRDLTNRFQLINNSYELHGDFKLPANVSATNLRANGSIQGVPFADFLESLIFKNEDNVTILGPKVFKSSVTFDGGLTITDSLNELNLSRFYKNVVFLDEPFSVKSKVIFESDIQVEKDVVVEKNFDANRVMGVDFKELQADIIYLNRPTAILETMLFTNVSFESDITVDQINNIDTQLLIPLHTDQSIPVDILKCMNVTAKKIQILGNINGYDLNTIYENTFMLFGDQNVTGTVKFRGNVYMRRDFHAKSINGIRPKQIVLLNTNETIVGNFRFKNPIVLDRSLRILGELNGIDPSRWQAVAVTTRFPIKQIISGEWIVHGNVYFRNGTSDDAVFNGVNVTEMAKILANENLQTSAALAEASINLINICEDLNGLKAAAENQAYEFNTFDYLEILKFESDISSVHHFEFEDLDYLLISYESCRMNAFYFTGERFELAATVADFGPIKEWFTFRSDKGLYFLTVGDSACGKSAGNLWKLEDDQFTHVLDLGNVTGSKEINHDYLLTMANQGVDQESARNVNENWRKSSNSDIGNDENIKLILENDELLTSSRNSMKKYNSKHENQTKIENSPANSETLRFKAGLFEKELLAYHDQEISANQIFILSNDSPQKRILQTIAANKPSSFIILNFDGSAETLFIFIENESNLRIYEYQGIQGFVYKNSVRIQAKKLFAFKIRKYSNLAKKHCLAIINQNRLTILEAKMYGEKLDIDELSCRNN